MSSTGLNSAGGLLHDTIKIWCCRWAEANGYAWEMEAKGECTDDKYIPDVVLRYKLRDEKRRPIVYIEVQLDPDDPVWKKKIETNYKNKEVMIIDLEKYNPKTEFETLSFWLSYAYKMLIDDLNGFTLSPPKPRKVKPKHRREKTSYDKVPCEFCGQKFSKFSRNGHQYRCTLNPANKKIEEDLP